jgi:hypothetical protein
MIACIESMQANFIISFVADGKTASPVRVERAGSITRSLYGTHL